jgi:hypothetical protein
MIARLVGACGFLLIFAGLAVPAQAIVEAPEIDAGSAGSALTLLTGAVMVLSSRFRRK